MKQIVKKEGAKKPQECVYDQRGVAQGGIKHQTSVSLKTVVVALFLVFIFSGMVSADTAYWSFNESSGDFVDSYGEDNNATNSGANYGVIGVWGNAVDCDGDATLTVMGGATALNYSSSDDFSIIGYINSTDNGDSLVIDKWWGGNDGWLLFLSGSYFKFYFNGQGGHPTDSLNIWINDTNVTDGVYHSFSFAYNGSKNASDMVVYIDGVLKTPYINTNTLSTDHDDDQPMHICGHGGLFLTGHLDELALLDHMVGSNYIDYFPSLTYPTDWPNSTELTFYHNSINLTDTPVIINVTDVDGMFDSLRFSPQNCSENNATILSHWIEWNDSTDAVVHLKLPNIEHGYNEFCMRWGNESASNIENASAVYSRYSMVLPLSETSGDHYDLTVNDNDGYDVTANQNAAGFYDGADSFNGVDDLINLSATSSLQAAAGENISICARIKTDTCDQGGLHDCMIYRMDDLQLDASRALMFLCIDDYYGCKGLKYHLVDDGMANTASVYDCTPGVHNLLDNNWHHVCGTFSSGDTIKIFVDGVLVNSTSVPAVTGAVNPSGGYGIGAFVRGPGAGVIDSFFNGSIDQLEYIKEELHPDEIAFMYNVSTGEAVTFGSEEEEELIWYSAWEENCNTSSSYPNSPWVQVLTLGGDFGKEDDKCYINDTSATDSIWIDRAVFGDVMKVNWTWMVNETGTDTITEYVVLSNDSTATNIFHIEWNEDIGVRINNGTNHIVANNHTEKNVWYYCEFQYNTTSRVVDYITCAGNTTYNISITENDDEANYLGLTVSGVEKDYKVYYDNIGQYSLTLRYPVSWDNNTVFWIYGWANTTNEPYVLEVPVYEGMNTNKSDVRISWGSSEGNNETFLEYDIVNYTDSIMEIHVVLPSTTEGEWQNYTLRWGNTEAVSAENQSAVFAGWGTVHHLEEASGPFTDDGPNSNDGIASGDTTYQEQGLFDGAAGFDGLGDSINISDHNSLDCTDELTVEAVVNLSAADDFNNLHHFLSKQNANLNGGGFQFYYDNRTANGPNRIAFFMDAGSGDNYITVSNTTEIIDDGWYHVLVTYDKNGGGTDEVKLMVDGRIVMTGDWSSSMGVNSNVAMIGGIDNDDFPNHHWGWNGTIDEARVKCSAVDEAYALQSAQMFLNQSENVIFGTTTTTTTTTTTLSTMDIQANINTLSDLYLPEETIGITDPPEGAPPIQIMFPLDEPQHEIIQLNASYFASYLDFDISYSGVGTQAGVNEYILAYEWNDQTLLENITYCNEWVDFHPECLDYIINTWSEINETLNQYSGLWDLILEIDLEEIVDDGLPATQGALATNLTRLDVNNPTGSIPFWMTGTGLLKIGIESSWFNITEVNSSSSITLTFAGGDNQTTYLNIPIDSIIARANIDINGSVHDDSLPSNVSVDVGNDSKGDTWNQTGEYNTTTNLNLYNSRFSEQIRHWIKSDVGNCGCSGCTIIDENCSLPLIIYSDTKGNITLDNVLLEAGVGNQSRVDNFGSINATIQFNMTVECDNSGSYEIAKIPYIGGQWFNLSYKNTPIKLDTYWVNFSSTDLIDIYQNTTCRANVTVFNETGIAAEDSYNFSIDVPHINLTFKNLSENTGSTFSAAFNISDGAECIDNCSLWTNFTGSWIRTEWNSSGIVNGPNIITTTSPANGFYLWNIQCLGSEYWGSWNYTLNQSADTPNITACWANQSIVLYDNNLTLYTNVSKTIWDIDTVLFNTNMNEWESTGNNSTTWWRSINTTEMGKNNLSCIVNDTTGEYSIMIGENFTVYRMGITGCWFNQTNITAPADFFNTSSNITHSENIDKVWFEIYNTSGAWNHTYSSKNNITWTKRYGSFGYLGDYGLRCWANETTGYTTSTVATTNMTVVTLTTTTTTTTLAEIWWVPPNRSVEKSSSSEIITTFNLTSNYSSNRSVSFQASCPAGWGCYVWPNIQTITANNTMFVDVIYITGDLEGTYYVYVAANTTAAPPSGDIATIEVNVTTSAYEGLINSLEGAFQGLRDEYTRLVVRMDNMLAGRTTSGEQYRIQVANNSLFISPIIDDLTYQIDYVLPRDEINATGTYFWRVRRLIKDTNMTSAWSIPQNFTVV